MWILYLLIAVIIIFAIVMIIAFAIVAIQYLLIAFVVVAATAFVGLIVFGVRKDIIEAIERNFFFPSLVYTAPKCNVGSINSYVNRESQVLTEEYNKFCDNYNKIQLYEAHKAFLENKIQITTSNKKSEHLNGELSQLVSDNEEAVNMARENLRSFTPSIFSDERLKSFFNVAKYIDGTSICAKGKRKKTIRYNQLLAEFFGCSTSIIISGRRSCAILLPEYVVIKRYNSSPFVCKPYVQSMFNIVLERQAPYRDSIHRDRKDPIRTVWKYQNKDGSKDLRYKDNPSQSFIDYADCYFNYSTGSEKIKKMAPCECYNDGVRFKGDWQRFFYDNERFNQDNEELLGSAPFEETPSATVVDDNKTADITTNNAQLDFASYTNNTTNNEDAPIVVPFNSPYHRDSIRPKASNKIDDFIKNK